MEPGSAGVSPPEPGSPDHAESGCKVVDVTSRDPVELTAGVEAHARVASTPFHPPVVPLNVAWSPRRRLSDAVVLDAVASDAVAADVDSAREVGLLGALPLSVEVPGRSMPGSEPPAGVAPGPRAAGPESEAGDETTPGFLEGPTGTPGADKEATVAPTATEIAAPRTTQPRAGPRARLRERERVLRAVEVGLVPGRPS